MTNCEKAIEKHGLITPDFQSYMDVGSDVKIRWVDKDGYQYHLSRANLTVCGRRDGGLSRFFNGNPYSEDNIHLYISEVTSGDVSIIEFTAKNAHDKIRLFSKKQGIEYEKSLNEFAHAPYCITFNSDYRNVRSYTLEEVKRMAFERFNISVLSESYNNNTSVLEFACNCKTHKGIVQTSSWANMISLTHHPCRFCSKEIKDKVMLLKSRENFWKRYNNSKTKNPVINIVGEYNGWCKKIRCKCGACGKEVFLRADHILRGIGCGKCTKSLGERLIEHFLVSHSIQFATQHIFDGCKMNKRAMPFDFYLPTYNVAIEFDGMQHFMPYGKFGGDNEFKLTQVRDSFKSNYCKKNEIKLIRIPFTDIDKIGDILSSHLTLKAGVKA